MVNVVLGPITFVLFLICSGAMKLSLNDVLESGSTQMFWTSVFSKEDTPYGSEQPYLLLDVGFTSQDKKDRDIDILIYDLNKAHVGYRHDSTPSYCCTLDLYKENICSKVGSAIFQPGTVTPLRVNFANNAYTQLNQKIEISTSGVHVLQFTNCIDNEIGSVTLNGTAEWYNPYGYLPGESYMKLPVSGIFALLYLVIAIAFGILVIKYKKILLYIQLGILAVIVYAAIENGAWYFYRIGLNNVGTYNFPALTFVVLLSSINRTVTRVLVLGIGMGLGVVKWTLGTTQTKVAILAIFYLFFIFLFQLYTEISSLAKSEILPTWVSLAIILPTACFDTLFYYWIVLSMIRTIQQLTLRCQVLKLDMYKKFLAVLVLVGILEVLVMAYRAYTRFFGTPLDWKHTWILDAYRETLYFIVVFAIGFLWRPRSNNMRYGYTEFFTDDETNLQNGGEGLEDIQLDTFSGDSKKGATKVKLSSFDKEMLSINLPQEEEGEGSVTEMRKME